MRLLVFQHVECEHPGRLREYLRRDGVDWRTVALDEGDEIPRLENYDALWVMGGPMDVWEEDKYPWLADERRAIRRWVRELRRPYLGLCLGHQLLADALGGECAAQVPPEIGVMKIQLTAAGAADSIFADMPESQTALQWHSVAVVAPPADAVVLAESKICANQAMRVGECAWSMQYHVEVEDDTVANWSQIPAYRQALSKALGDAALPKLQTAAAQNMPAFAQSAQTLYRNFMQAVG